MGNFPSQKPVFLQSGDPLTENRPADSYSPGQLGQKFSFREPTIDARQQTFQLVQMDSVLGATPAEGCLAYWRDRTGYVITTSIAASARGNVAGVLGADIDVDNICCIQIGGLAPVQFVTPPTSLVDHSGKDVIPSSTNGKADTMAPGTAPTYPSIGKTAGFLSNGVATVDLDEANLGRD